jgi:hypothetical protein
MRRAVSFLAFLFLPIPTANAQGPAADWPQFRGPGGLGVSTDKGVPITWGPNQNIAWKVALAGPGASSPVTFGDRIFLTCWTGYNIPGQPAGNMDQLKRWVLCLNRADGKILWQQEVKSVLPEQAEIREGHGYASSTPVVDRERVYAFFGKSGVVALDHEGKQLWHADVGSGLNGWGTGASPVLYGDLLIVNASVESASLVALDRKTGKEVWRAGGIKESWNTPLLVAAPGGKTELVVAILGKVLAFDPATGTALWNCRTDISWYMVPSLVAHDGIVYCIGGRSGPAALAVRSGGRGDVTKTHHLWVGNKGSNVSSPIYHEGHLYWAHDGLGVVYCAEAKSGKVVYEQRLDRVDQIYASPVLADGKLYYQSRRGTVYVLAARPRYELLAQNSVAARGESFLASPAVSRGQLLLRSDRYLYCIGTGK